MIALIHWFKNIFPPISEKCSREGTLLLKSYALHCIGCSHKEIKYSHNMHAPLSSYI